MRDYSELNSFLTKKEFFFCTTVSWLYVAEVEYDGTKYVNVKQMSTDYVFFLTHTSDRMSYWSAEWNYKVQRFDKYKVQSFFVFFPLPKWRIGAE